MRVENGFEVGSRGKGVGEGGAFCMHASLSIVLCFIVC